MSSSSMREFSVCFVGLFDVRFRFATPDNRTPFSFHPHYDAPHKHTPQTHTSNKSSHTLTYTRSHIHIHTHTHLTVVILTSDTNIYTVCLFSSNSHYPLPPCTCCCSSFITFSHTTLSVRKHFLFIIKQLIHIHHKQQSIPYLFTIYCCCCYCSITASIPRRRHFSGTQGTPFIIVCQLTRRT